MERSKLKGIAAVVGTVIGAGTLGIPYVISKTGFAIGFTYLVVICLMSLLVMLYVVELVLRTKKIKQMPGLAEKYLGKWGKRVMMVSQLVGIYGALIAYLTGIGASASELLGGNSMIYSTFFFLISIPIIFKGLKAIEKTESWLSALKIILLIVLCVILLPNLNFDNFSGTDMSFWFLPYGVFMFAFAGYTVIPNIERIMEKNKKELKNVIIIGLLICFLIYLLFSSAFVGYFGDNVSQIATEGLPGGLGIFADIAAIFLLATPFLILSWVLKDTFKYDYKVSSWLSTALACLVPFLLMLVVKPTFIQMLEISGGYAISLVYILTAFMVKKARKDCDDKPEFVVPFGDLPLIFIALFGFLGMVYTTIGLF